MEKIVSNTSTIIFLSKLKIFNLAKNLYSEILIPSKVKKEIFKQDKPENIYIEKELENFIKIKELEKIRELPLDIGEKAAISLCLEKNIQNFLSDDKKARTYARSLKIKTVGVIGIILKNLQIKKINKSQAKELIKSLINYGYYMSPILYNEVMNLIDE